MEPTSPGGVEVVAAWQAAATDGEAERVLALSAPDIELVGPRGVARGHAALRAWLARAAIELATQATFSRGGAVVVEQRARWRPPDGATPASERTVASAFEVRDGRVARVARYDTLAEALADGGLSADDRVREA